MTQSCQLPGLYPVRSSGPRCDRRAQAKVKWEAGYRMRERLLSPRQEGSPRQRRQRARSHWEHNRPRQCSILWWSTRHRCSGGVPPGQGDRWSILPGCGAGQLPWQKRGYRSRVGEQPDERRETFFRGLGLPCQQRPAQARPAGLLLLRFSLWLASLPPSFCNVAGLV